MILSAPKDSGGLHRHMTSPFQTPGGELSDNVLAGSQPLFRLMWYVFPLITPLLTPLHGATGLPSPRLYPNVYTQHSRKEHTYTQRETSFGFSWENPHHEAATWLISSPQTTGSQQLASEDHLPAGVRVERCRGCDLISLKQQYPKGLRSAFSPATMLGCGTRYPGVRSHSDRAR